MYQLRRAEKKAIMFFLLLSITFMSVPITGKAAKAKNPTLNKRDLSLEVGQSTKISIKNAKKVKSTKWSVKPTKYVSLTQKKKTSVVVNGKKQVKKVVLRAKIKIGKKNKTLKCNIKVNRKANPKPSLSPSLPPVSADGITGMTFRGNSYYVADTIIVSLKREKVLKATDFTIKVKTQQNGNYMKLIEINDVYTVNNTDYQIRLSDYILNGEIVQCSISGIVGNGTFEKQFKSSGFTNETLVVGKVGEEVFQFMYFENLLGYSTKKISSGTFPEGVVADYELGYIEGNPKATADNKKVVIAATDEYGTVSTSTLNFLIGSDTEMYGESATIGDRADNAVYTNYDFSKAVYVAGGSNNYENAELLNDYNGVFYLDNEGMVYTDEGDYGYTYIYADADALVEAGNYKLEIKFTDAQDPSLTAIGTLNLTVTKTNRVVTTFGNLSENVEYLTTYFENTSTGDIFFSGYPEEDTMENQVIYYLPDGTYELYANQYEKEMILTRNLSVRENTELSCDLPPLFELSGTIKDKNNEIYEDSCQLVLCRADNNSELLSIDTYSGEYSFPLLPQGEYIIKAYSYDSDETHLAYLSGILAVNGDLAHDITLSVERVLLPALSGEVQLSSTDIIAEDEMLYVIMYTEDEVFAYESVVEDGTYFIEDVEPGNYYISVVTIDEDFNLEELYRSELIEMLTEDQTFDINLDI
ncbi:MAG: hypothetical protein LBR68_06575 [Lachnoclostridium sp.]|jgi:hypothetical protein|nr:hypothetical protein [Lachnoclostridium sp.]